MRFWVKRYEKGEVARWLHAKRVGENVEIRGPVQTWGWREGVWDEVVMVSALLIGGCGRECGTRLMLDFRRDGHNAVLPAGASDATGDPASTRA